MGTPAELSRTMKIQWIVDANHGERRDFINEPYPKVIAKLYESCKLAFDKCPTGPLPRGALVSNNLLVPRGGRLAGLAKGQNTIVSVQSVSSLTRIHRSSNHGRTLL